MRLEVRCCCKPKKLLGWMEVSEDSVRGRCLRFIVPPKWNGPAIFEAVDLEIADYFDGEKHYTALKDNEVPLKTLRLIPSFTENV